MLKNYFIISVRNIRRSKIYSFINILGLSTGLAFCILMLLYTKDEISFDRFHKNIKNIYQLTCHRFSKHGEDYHFAIAAMVQGPAFKQEIPEIESFVRVNNQTMLIKIGPKTFYENATWVDSNFFSFFSFPLLDGDKKKVLTELHSIVITNKIANKYFGTQDAIGKILEIELDGKFQPFVVTGIAEQTPQNSSIQFNLILPFKYLEITHPDNGWMWVSYPTYFTVNPNASIKAVANKMNQVFENSAKEEIETNKLLGYTDKFVWGLQHFENMHLQTRFEGNPGAVNPVYSYIFTAISVFILIIACINFINLSIAQSMKRNIEIGLRKVIGAKRSQIFKQFLGESFFICIIAFVIALMLAELLLPIFNELTNKKLSLSYLMDYKLICVFILLFITTGFATGFYPSIVLSKFNPIKTLFSNSKIMGKNYFGKVLTVLQFGIVTFLIVCTVFIYLQFDYLTQTKLGYNDKNLIELTIGSAVMNWQLNSKLKTELNNSSGVELVALQNVGKFGGKTIAAGKEVNARYIHCDENYILTLQIPIIAGRNFSKDFPTDSSKAVIVNETFAKKIGWQNAVGKTIDYMNFPGWGNRKVTVIGVVKDYHFESLKEEIKPEVLTLEPNLPLGKFLIRIKPKDIPSTIRNIEKVYHKIIPLHPFQYGFKKDLNLKNYALELKEKQIIGWSAILITLIACIGLFGLTSLSIRQRTKEMGIRKVLGSSIFEIYVLLSKQFLFLILISFLIAAPASWIIVTKWLQNFAYKINISIWEFLFAGSITFLISLLTVSYHSIQLIKINPVDELRAE